MPKTRDAFAFADFDATKILQRPFFKAWRERYEIRTDETDSAVIHSDSVMLDFVDGDTEKEKLQKAERYNQQLRELCNLLLKLHNMITRHANERLEPYRRAVQAKIDAEKNPCQSLQARINREQGLVSDYVLGIAMAVADLHAAAQKRYQDSEKNLQAEYRRRFGERLRQAREAAGLSRKELSAETNISVNAINYYENGQREPSLTGLKRLARTLRKTQKDVTPNWLIEFDEAE